jgi:hypothetical protein
VTNVQRNAQSSWKHPAQDHYLLLSAFWDIEALNRYLERSRKPQPARAAGRNAHRRAAIGGCLRITIGDLAGRTSGLRRVCGGGFSRDRRRA